MGTETSQTAGVPQTAPDTLVSDVNWTELDDDFADLGGAEDLTSQETFASETVEQAPAVQAPQTPVASPEPQQPAVQQPAQEVQQPQTQVEQPQQLPPGQSPEELRAQYEQNLEQGYALSEEDAVALLTQPETVLPKLAKNMHMRVMQEVHAQMQQMMQAVPQMLQVEAERVQREESAKSDFFGTWPGLKDHYQAVVANARMARQANPTASRTQIIEMAGMLTAVALGVDPGTLRGQQQAQRQVSQAPAPRPLRPVGPAGSPAGLPPPTQNTFSQFADDDLNWS